MTLRQIKLAKELGKSRTKKEAMLKAGYAPSTAHQQSRTFEKKGFKELLEQYLPLDKAFKVTDAALTAVKLDQGGEVVDDHAIRLKATDQVYKLHNVLQPDATHVGDNITVNIQTYGDTDNFRTPGLATTFRDNPEQGQIQNPQLAPKST